MKREGQPDKTINNMIKRDTTKSRLSEDRMKVGLTSFVVFIFFLSLTFVSMRVGAVKSTQKRRWYITIFSTNLVMSRVTTVFCYVTHGQVYVPQNTSVPHDTSRIYFQYKIWKKHAKYFILVNIY